MNLYLVTLTGNRCGLLPAANLQSARAEAARQSGVSEVARVEPARQRDVDWVRAMGGRVPEGRVFVPARHKQTTR